VLDIGQDELVLDIGAGYGYSSAVIAHMAQAVVALEEDNAMVEEAKDALVAANADNVVIEHGSLVAGAAEHGPYDVIIIQGGVSHLPQAIISQLKEGGRIACLFMEDALGEVRIGYKMDEHISWRRSFNAGAPVLNGFERHIGFQL
jgi:protein-L-isoaspartate(D-aspartate) O-methyltransferase